MDIRITNEPAASGNLSWLGSKHATNDAQTVTLDAKKFAGIDGSYIPSGTPLKKSEDGKHFEPVAAAGDTLAGFLLTDQPKTDANQIAPMVWHGRIRVARLPQGAFDVSSLSAVPGAFVLDTAKEA